MANSLTVNVRQAGGGRLIDLATGASQPAVFGASGLVLPAAGLSFANGSDDLAANQWYLARRTLAGTTFDLLDMAGGLTNGLGQAVTFSKLKYAWVGLVDPNGTRRLRVGPQNQSSAAQLWWGGTGATAYAEIYDRFEGPPHRYAGWTVTGGSADVFPVYNPTGSSIEYAIWLIGVQ